jgi:hypothetical protein
MTTMLMDGLQRMYLLCINSGVYLASKNMTLIAFGQIEIVLEKAVLACLKILY